MVIHLAALNTWIDARPISVSVLYLSLCSWLLLAGWKRTSSHYHFSLEKIQAIELMAVNH